MVREVRPFLMGRQVVSAALSHNDVLAGVSRRTLLNGLRGARVRRVARRAKHVVIETDSRRLVVQPGMTGSLQVGRPSRDGYAVLRARLDDGRELVYRDVRRLGTLRWLDEPAWQRYSTSIGPEPLDPAFTGPALHAALQRSRTAVKKVLMDQRRLAGVGNIYANEALFAAGIDPSKPACRIVPDAAERLHGELVRILSAAIRSQGTTIRDYRTGSGDPGGFQLRLEVYGREGAPCRRCGTLLVGTHAIDARITVFCHRCQR